jgi:hypothetical protein
MVTANFQILVALHDLASGICEILRGVITPVPPHAFIAWRGATLPLPLCVSPETRHRTRNEQLYSNVQYLESLFFFFFFLLSNHLHLSVRYKPEPILDKSNNTITWINWLQYRKLQLIFNVSPASLQTFIDTKLTLSPSVMPNYNYVIMVNETV